MATHDEEIVTIVGERVAETVYNYFPLPASSALGGVQIVCSVAIGCILSYALGIEIGILITLPLVAQWVFAGAFGIAAGTQKTPCMIATSLVMSILAMLTSIGLFFVALGLLYAHKYVQNNYGKYIEIKIDISSYATAVLFFSFIVVVISFTAAIIDCKFVCFCCRHCCSYNLTTTDKIRLSVPAVEPRQHHHRLLHLLGIKHKRKKQKRPQTAAEFQTVPDEELINNSSNANANNNNKSNGNHHDTCSNYQQQLMSEYGLLGLLGKDNQRTHNELNLSTTMETCSEYV